MKCPSCGAEIGANSKFCESCGSQITYAMRREIEQVNKVGCPNCGSSNIQFERENQGEVDLRYTRRVIRQTVGFCKDCGHTWVTSDENQSSAIVNGIGDIVPTVTNVAANNTWIWVLGWVFFFPAPVMVLIWRKKNTWDLKVKIAVTVAFWLLIYIIGRS